MSGLVSTGPSDRTADGYAFLRTVQTIAEQGVTIAANLAHRDWRDAQKKAAQAKRDEPTASAQDTDASGSGGSGRLSIVV